MVIKEQITNKEIRNLFERYINGKKGKIFFLISISPTINDQKAEAIHELSNQYTGEDEFMKILDEAFESNPYSISFSFYEKKDKKLNADTPIFFRQVILNKTSNQANNPLSLGNVQEGVLGAFGGLQGMLQAQVSSQLLTHRNSDLSTAMNKLENKIIELEKLNGELIKKNDELNHEIHVKEWDIRNIEQKHASELGNIEQKHVNELGEIKRSYDKFESALRIGGTILANKAGLDANEIRGLLGFGAEETKSISDGKNGENKNLDDVDFVETNTNEFTGKKADAINIVSQINAFLVTVIKENEEENAFRLINSIGHVFAYMQKDIENLRLLVDLIASETAKEKG